MAQPGPMALLLLLRIAQHLNPMPVFLDPPDETSEVSKVYNSGVYVDLSKSSIGTETSEIYSAYTSKSAISIAAPVLLHSLSASYISSYYSSVAVTATLDNYSFVGFKVEGTITEGYNLSYGITGYKDDSWSNITHLYYEGSNSRAGSTLNDIIPCPPPIGFEQIKLSLSYGGAEIDVNFSIYALKLYPDDISISVVAGGGL